ncbi:unnamed protein product [Spirodela intermedia]|uniref:Delta(3)-Delta(2)-enoyl-CoA isomerase n=1 Tax=Spirodela intermedia TaxID=51605 RepID=A0A7I8LKA6_SPIIN|nr:unnamed protein product [Spirodela intermedia]
MCSLEKRGRVYVLTLTGDGEHRLNLALIDGLRAALSRVRTEIAAEPRGGFALVTTAEGKFFSNGFDLAWSLAAGSPAGSRKRLEQLVSMFSPVVADLMAMPLPTIAAVNGHAAAAGFMLALSHDYIFMRKDRGVLYMSELELGLSFPGYFLSLMRAKFADPSTLRDVVLRASKFRAAEAVERKIIDAAVETPEATLEAAIRMGEQLAGRKWEGMVYASIRIGAFPELCRAVGLVVEDEEMIKMFNAKL